MGWQYLLDNDLESHAQWRSYLYKYINNINCDTFDDKS